MGSVVQRAAKLPLNFENHLNPVEVECGQTGLTKAGAERQTFS